MEEYFIDKFGVKFSKNKKNLIRCPEIFRGQYIVPFGVEVIGKRAFDGCTDLVSVKIPSSVTEIEDECMVLCNALQNFVVPESVKRLGDRTISKCSNLVTVYLPSTILSLGNGMFEECPNLKAIYIPNGTKQKFVQLGLQDVKEKLIEEGTNQYILSLKILAERGLSEAQYQLGKCYRLGEGVPQSYESAVEWFRKSAEQGNAMAQNNLGVCYWKGKGVPQSYESAVEWYRKSAEQGNANAQHNLGVCYKKGQGVPQSYEMAAEWYIKSAEQGNANAQNNLGVCYSNGQGVTQSYEKAIEWFKKSAEQGNETAQTNLERCKKKLQDSLSNSTVFLPDWLDDYIYDHLGATYSPRCIDMTNINDDYSMTLNYLGTYFPRSYAESYQIFTSYFLQNDTKFSNKQQLSIFDFGSGTGGEIIGLITVIEKFLPNVRDVRIWALDGNPDAISLYNKVLSEFRKQSTLEIVNYSLPIKIDNLDDLESLDFALKDNSYDIILSFKSICEFVSKQRFEDDNPYEYIAQIMQPRLNAEGLLLIEDITTYSDSSGEWLPKMMDAGIKKAGCKVIAENEGYNQTYTVSHSRKQYDVSKVAWRMIAAGPKCHTNNKTFYIKYDDLPF